MELEIVEIADGRCQILDKRGALVRSVESRSAAEEFRAGYRLGREDGARIVRSALEPIPERVALSRT